MKDLRDIKTGTIVLISTPIKPVGLRRVTQVTDTEFTAGGFRFMKSTGKVRGAFRGIMSASFVSPADMKAVKAERLRQETKTRAIQALESILADYKSEDLTDAQKAKVHSFIKEF